MHQGEWRGRPCRQGGGGDRRGRRHRTGHRRGPARRRARVVIADIEAPVLESTVAQLSADGDVRGVVTDVSDPASVEALADLVFDQYGACHLLWNNAGVTSGGGGNPWDQEPNDWRWCFGVNVFGTSNGVLSFVPRMIASGQPGAVVTTSSGDGGIAPVPYASVYASSKAAIGCFTEALAHQFIAQKTKLSASVFYPSGGLFETGLWEAQRNRPRGPGPPAAPTACPGHHLRRVQGDPGRRRAAHRYRGPGRAGPLRRPGREGGTLRDRPRSGPGRPAAARPGRSHRRGTATPLGPRGADLSGPGPDTDTEGGPVTETLGPTTATRSISADAHAGRRHPRLPPLPGDGLAR